MNRHSQLKVCIHVIRASWNTLKIIDVRTVYVVCLKGSVNGTRKQTKHTPQRQIRGVQWVVFFLFPRLKSIMKGACFADVAAIQECVTAVL
jgi:hypothetical protein